MPRSESDIVVIGATPGGIMAAIAAARRGCHVLLVDRNAHIGGLPANGLGATDIHTRGATGGLFSEFVARIRRHYAESYGASSDQVAACSDGYRFEPHVAEQTFNDMLAEQGDRITVLRRHQFDAEPANVEMRDGRLVEVTVVGRDTGERISLRAKVFIDGTYEGDLADAAGAPSRTGREDHREFGEPMAGRLYKQWGGEVCEGSTGRGDNAVQSYNYRLCLSRNPDDRVPVPKPDTYRREDYASIADDIREGRVTSPSIEGRREMAFDGIGRVTNMVALPNGKTDANNQHLAFVSTDLPEENWPWPTSGWDWRDRFARRLRDYTLGLLWFVQNDAELPADFRERCAEWGLARSEYADNGHFPRDVYVREGRRIVGEHLFTAHDARPRVEGHRPPIYADSITASHYALDSHAVRKREPGRVHLDGFFSFGSRPYTVPYGVILPTRVEGLLTPVPVSGTHIGFSTLRMEPCWMALGQAAGSAAALAVEQNVVPKAVDIVRLQTSLVDEGAVLMYFTDVDANHPHFKALQALAPRGYFQEAEWEARLDDILTTEEAAAWSARSSLPDSVVPGTTTRGEALSAIHAGRHHLSPKAR